MLIGIKQRSLSLAVYDVISYRKDRRERFGFVEEAGETRAYDVTLLGHKYRLQYSFATSIGTTFDGIHPISLIEPIGQDPMIARYPFAPETLPRDYRVMWRGHEFHMTEAPVYGDGLYYPIIDSEDKTRAIIERGTTINVGLDNYMLTIERDGDVAMAIMAALYIDVLTSISGKETRDCEIELPENTAVAVDKDFIKRVTQNALRS